MTHAAGADGAVSGVEFSASQMTSRCPAVASIADAVPVLAWLR